MQMVEINGKELSVVGKREPVIQNALLFPNAPTKASPQALLTSSLLASTSPDLFLGADSQCGTVLWCDGLECFLVSGTNCSQGDNKLFVCFQCS